MPELAGPEPGNVRLPHRQLPEHYFFKYVSFFFHPNAAVDVYYHPLRNKFKQEKISVTKPQEKANHFKIKH